MVCFKPIEAYLPGSFDADLKRHLIFSPKKIYEFKRSTVFKFEKAGILKAFDESNFDLLFDEKRSYPDIHITTNINDMPDGYILRLPCGKCDGCKLDYSRNWATRAINEASFYNYYRNCAFLSLTFNDENLSRTNLGYSVDKAFFKSWVKRLRFAVKSTYGVEFRHLSCGEYGAKRGRPHYHMIIFGFDFPDRYVFKRQHKYGKVITYYRSPFLESLWHLPYSDEQAGYCVIGSVNYETCAYVARYVLKKQHKSTYGDKQPEFLSVSRMPGLGSNYCIEYLNTIFSNGYIMLPSGHKSPIPRYYESVCERLNPELYFNYKFDKFQSMHDRMLQNFYTAQNPDQLRLSQLNELTQLRLNRLSRNYELDNDNLFC